MLSSHRQPVLQATEPKATIPTGNRSASIERSLGRGPWRIPGGSLEGPCISQCCVFQRFERILRNLWRVPRGSPAKSCWKVPRGAWCKPCSVVQIIAGTSVSAPGGDAQTPAIYEYTYTCIYTHIYICTCMLGIHDFPKVLIQSGGSHMQHANPVQLFIHTHARPAPNHKEFSRNPIGILLES